MSENQEQEIKEWTRQHHAERANIELRKLIAETVFKCEQLYIDTLAQKVLECVAAKSPEKSYVENLETSTNVLMTFTREGGTQNYLNGCCEPQNKTLRLIV